MSDLSSICQEIFRMAVRAADPALILRRCIFLSGRFLRIGEEAYDLDRYKRILLVGAGKAAPAMAAALEGILGGCQIEGLVVTREGCGLPAHLRQIEVMEAAHPLPDERSIKAAKRILEHLSGSSEEDLVLFLISGGGSALMEYPASSLSLEDLVHTNSLLLSCGAAIREINCVRKHLSAIKGGNLLSVAYPATTVTLIISDVLGSPVDAIASGPTAPDPTTFLQALGILEKYGLQEAVRAGVKGHLEAGARGEIPETPKPGEKIFTRSRIVILADNSVLVEEAAIQAKNRGFLPLVLSTFIEGEAREVGRVLASVSREIRKNGRPVSPPVCLIGSGETTVTVRGTGRGGRNQEMALSFALAAEGIGRYAFLAGASDGIDGPTDAAGAVVDDGTLREARLKGLDPEEHLRNNDSYNFFALSGGLQITGATNTNVNDLYLALLP